MARIEGTGIKTPSSGSQKMAKVYYGGLEAEKRRRLSEEVKQMMKDFGSSPASDPMPKGRGMGDRFDPTASRPNYFSPGGGAFDERNNVQIASADLSSLDVGDSTADDGFNQFLQKDFGVSTDSSTYKSFPNYIRKDLKNQYRDSLKFKEGTQINQAPVKEKPSLLERTANFAGSIFNTVTGTQSAAASEMPTARPSARPSATQFSSKNLDAARDTSFSSYVRGGGEGQERGSVSTSTPKQTVASLPSDYKQTEARAFAKSKAIKSAKKNPNTEVSIGDKGQAKVKAVQKTRKEAGPKARTAEGNKARVKQNARARAQAAAYNRKISGEKPKSAKERAQASAKARRAAGPNRKMSDGQKTRAQAGPSARTAQGNRARVKSNARKRAQAAARRRRACDIFLKHDISPLTNMNLIKDDLAEVAYFVKEIQK